MRTRVFFQYLIPYLVVLVLTLVLGIAVYTETSKIVRQQVVDVGLRSLENGRDLVDNQFARMDVTIAQLGQEREVVEYLRLESPVPSPDYYPLIQVRNRLATYSSLNDFISAIYIYSNRSRSVVSGSVVELDAERFYSQLYRYVDLAFDEWLREMGGGYSDRVLWPARPVIVENASRSFLTYVQSVPTGAYRTYRGVVWVAVSESSVWDYFADADDLASGGLVAVDASGSIVTAIGSPELVDAVAGSLVGRGQSRTWEQHVDGTDVVVLSAPSRYNGLTFLRIVPSRVFLNQVTHITVVFGATSAALILLGIAASLGFARRNTRPVKRLLALVASGSESSRTDAFSQIESSVTSLLDRNRHLRTKLAEQLPHLRAGVLERLFRGAYMNETEAADALAKVGVEIHYEVLLVCAVRVVPGRSVDWSAESQDVMRVLLSRVVTDALPSGTIIHYQGSELVAALLRFRREELAEIRVRAEREIEAKLSEMQAVSASAVRVGFSSPVETLELVGRAYSQAMTALEYAGDCGTPAWFDELHTRAGAYSYPIEDEEALILQTRAGNYPGAVALISKIEALNDLSSMPLATRIQFTSEIRGTIDRLRSLWTTADPQGAARISEMAHGLFEGATEGFFDRVRRVYESICHSTGAGSQNHRAQLVSEVLSFISENYTHPDIGLTMIADNFGLTEGYLSHFFKEQTGENFSNFVERLRMNRVSELLSLPNTAISDAAASVGYRNQNTFYRACKRIFGVSPTELRDRIRASTGSPQQ